LIANNGYPGTLSTKNPVVKLHNATNKRVHEVSFTKDFVEEQTDTFPPFSDPWIYETSFTGSGRFAM
jgi:hypothetical protein